MGKASIFNPAQQAGNVSSKVVAALERLSEAFRVLLWNEAKQYGLSPIQIQVLIFLQHYPEEKRTVTYLASYFNMTKATISDAVKSLESKKLLIRKAMANDSRSHTLHLVKDGKTLAAKVERFAQPMVMLPIAIHREYLCGCIFLRCTLIACITPLIFILCQPAKPAALLSNKYKNRTSASWQQAHLTSCTV